MLNYDKYANTISHFVCGSKPNKSNLTHFAKRAIYTSKWEMLC
jgi:hypothetical protein